MVKVKAAHYVFLTSQTVIILRELVLLSQAEEADAVSGRLPGFFNRAIQLTIAGKYSERIVIEIKREMKDASFDSLAKSYAGQTTDYQNVSIRLGFLLVLDLTEPKLEGAPHIRSLVQCRSIQRACEMEPRQIVIVKVPGRRYLPSEISKGAKHLATSAKLAPTQPNE